MRTTSWTTLAMAVLALVVGAASVLFSSISDVASLDLKTPRGAPKPPGLRFTAGAEFGVKATTTTPRLEGRTIGVSSLAPVSGVPIIAETSDGLRFEVTSSIDGTFAFSVPKEELAVGQLDWSIRIQSSYSLDSKASFVEAGSGPHDRLVLATSLLEPAHSLKLLYKDGDSTPVPYCQCTLLERRRAIYSAATDKKGVVRFPVSLEDRVTAVRIDDSAYPRRFPSYIIELEGTTWAGDAPVELHVDARPTVFLRPLSHSQDFGDGAIVELAPELPPGWSGTRTILSGLTRKTPSGLMWRAIVDADETSFRSVFESREPCSVLLKSKSGLLVANGSMDGLNENILELSLTVKSTSALEVSVAPRALAAGSADEYWLAVVRTTRRLEWSPPETWFPCMVTDYLEAYSNYFDADDVCELRWLDPGDYDVTLHSAGSIVGCQSVHLAPEELMTLQLRK